AGLLPLLAGAAGETSGRRDEVLAGLRQAAGWTVRRLHGEPRPSPGLYFGQAGISWALFEAARALDDGELRAKALGMAHELPTEWPQPDICHGLAGAGLAQLHFWQATGDDVFAERACAAADTLVKVAITSDDGILWEIPGDFDSALAGVRHWGFGHGVAGIGAFLLASARAT
ncbi:lanthionine synthetase LanC family protein, partial [Streptosporangium algeriense]